MPIFKINRAGAIIGCVVAKNKDVASAYAIGRYGAGANTVKVNYQDAVEAFGICVLISTHELENKQGLRIET